MKFCKDCKWCNGSESEYAECLNPNIYSVSVVTGKVIGDACFISREYKCKEAKFFEGKENV